MVRMQSCELHRKSFESNGIYDAIANNKFAIPSTVQRIEQTSLNQSTN